MTKRDDDRLEILRLIGEISTLENQIKQADSMLMVSAMERERLDRQDQQADRIKARNSDLLRSKAADLQARQADFDRRER